MVGRKERMMEGEEMDHILIRSLLEESSLQQMLEGKGGFLMNKQRCFSDEIHIRNLSQTNNTIWIKTSIHMLVRPFSFNSPAVRPVWLWIGSQARNPLWVDSTGHGQRHLLSCLSRRFISICPRSILQSFWTGPYAGWLQLYVWSGRQRSCGGQSSRCFH